MTPCCPHCEAQYKELLERREAHIAELEIANLRLTAAMETMEKECNSRIENARDAMNARIAELERDLAYERERTANNAAGQALEVAELEAERDVWMRSCQESRRVGEHMSNEIERLEAENETLRAAANPALRDLEHPADGDILPTGHRLHCTAHPHSLNSWEAQVGLYCERCEMNAVIEELRAALTTARTTIYNSVYSDEHIRGMINTALGKEGGVDG